MMVAQISDGIPEVRFHGTKEYLSRGQGLLNLAGTEDEPATPRTVFGSPDHKPQRNDLLSVANRR